MSQEEERRTVFSLTHTFSLCSCRSLSEVPLPWTWIRILALPPLTPSSFWIRDNQSTGIPCTPPPNLHACAIDLKMCCPASLQGRTSQSQLLQGLPQLQRPSSPRSSPAARVGPDSDRQHSPQHSWPGWPMPLRTYITLHLLALPIPVSSSFPSQWLNLLNI